jgi:hypothetical protein
MQSSTINKIIALGIIGLGLFIGYLFIFTHQTAPEQQKAEQIVLLYLKQKQPNIQPYTPEYKIFLKDLLLGVYPELTNRPEGIKIQEYALAYLGIKPDEGLQPQLKGKE